MNTETTPQVDSLFQQQPVRRKKAVVAKLCDYESAIYINDIPSVAERLSQHHLEDSFAVFTIKTKIDSEDTYDNSINIQFAIENGKLGLEWPLVRSRNWVDKQLVLEFIDAQGFKATEQVLEFAESELYDLDYLRVEDGDLIHLCVHLIKSLYQVEESDPIYLLVDGFEHPDLYMEDVLNHVRQCGRENTKPTDLDRIESILRMIHGKSTAESDTDAYVQFYSEDGSIRFTDVNGAHSAHTFWSEVLVTTLSSRVEELFFGNENINILAACGYHHLYTYTNHYEKWFSVTNDADFRKLAEFCTGILHCLFGHQMNHSIEVDFFMPGPVEGSLPRWDDLPEPEQNDYCNFKMLFHNAIGRFHTVMSISEEEITTAENEALIRITMFEMETVIHLFPAWLNRLTGHRLSFAIENYTEITESLLLMHRLYVKPSLN